MRVITSCSRNTAGQNSSEYFEKCSHRAAVGWLYVMTAFEYPAANTSWAPAAALAGALGVLRLCLTNTDKRVTKMNTSYSSEFLVICQRKSFNYQ